VSESKAGKFIKTEEKLIREKILNRYTQLLLSMVALFIASPFLLKVEAQFPFVSLIFVLILLLALRAIRIPKSVYIPIMILAVTAFALECIFNFQLLQPYRRLVSVISLNLYALFIGLTIVVMIHNLFSQAFVSVDSVRGGISIYLLIGVFWAVVFELLFVHDPHAFILTTGQINGDARYLLFYFSFTTLTTTGFGDIVPNSELARIFSALESLCGVLFLTILVAQLVSLHVFHKTQLKNR